MRLRDKLCGYNIIASNLNIILKYLLLKIIGKKLNKSKALFNYSNRF